MLKHLTLRSLFLYALQVPPLIKSSDALIQTGLTPSLVHTFGHHFFYKHWPQISQYLDIFVRLVSHKALEFVLNNENYIQSESQRLTILLKLSEQRAKQRVCAPPNFIAIKDYTF